MKIQLTKGIAFLVLVLLMVQCTSCIFYMRDKPHFKTRKDLEALGDSLAEKENEVRQLEIEQILLRDSFETLRSLVLMDQSTYPEYSSLKSIEGSSPLPEGWSMANATGALDLILNATRYTVYKADLKEEQIKLFWRTSRGKPISSLSNLAKGLARQGIEPRMLTNGGMYTPAGAPQGLYVERGKTLNPIDLGKGPQNQFLNFYMLPNGVFFMKGDSAAILETQAFHRSNTQATFATQSGPLLVKEGQINSHFTPGSNNKKIRSGVGVDLQGNPIFIISRSPVNFHDFALLFRDAMDCPNALYLDGSVSQLHTRGYDTGDGAFGVMIAVLPHP